MPIEYIIWKIKELKSIDPWDAEPNIFTKSDLVLPFRKRLVGVYLLNMTRSILEMYLRFQVCATYNIVPLRIFRLFAVVHNICETWCEIVNYTEQQERSIKICNNVFTTNVST